jgi:Protein of unknown function (DUF1579)
MQIPQPTPEHQFLLQLVGDWTLETTCNMGPDQPATVMHGKQSTRALGSLWTLGEMESLGSEGEPMRSLITLGFDPARGKFVGSFIASCMTYHWLYEGSLDQAHRVLTLDAEGPSVAEEGSLAKYQDIIEVLDHDTCLFSSQYLDGEGKWVKFMQGTHRRVR